MRLQTMRVVYGVHFWGARQARDKFGMRQYELDRQIDHAEREECLRLFAPRPHRVTNWHPVPTMAGQSWLAGAGCVCRHADNVLGQAGAFTISEPNPRNVSLDDLLTLGNDKLFRYSLHKRRERLESWLGIDRLYDRHRLTPEFRALIPCFAELAEWVGAHFRLMDHVYEVCNDPASRLPPAATGGNGATKSLDPDTLAASDEAASVDAGIEALGDEFSHDSPDREGEAGTPEAVK